jgi:hypothetical protein
MANNASASPDQSSSVAVRETQTSSWERFRADVTNALKKLFASNTIQPEQQNVQKLVEKVI